MVFSGPSPPCWDTSGYSKGKTIFNIFHKRCAESGLEKKVVVLSQTSRLHI